VFALYSREVVVVVLLLFISRTTFHLIAGEFGVVYVYYYFSFKMNPAVKISETPKRVLMPSEAFRPEAKKWCVSKCDVKKFQFEWNIQQFLLVAEDQRFHHSIEFQEEPSSLKWNLAINNNRLYDEFGFVVTSEEDYYERRCYRVKLAILNKKREKLWPQEFDNFQNGSYFVDKKSISNDVLLTDGSLTICCEIEYAGDKREKVTDNEIICPQPINCINQMATQQERLFEDMQFSDIILNVHGRQFQAHKCILVSSSKVFEAMFNHPTKENITNQVVIEDIQPEVFHQLLRFIYTCRLNSATMETMATRLLAAADKYLLDQLKSECESHLRLRMSADNCLELLLLNDQIHPADDLKQSAVDFFRRYPREVMATDGWKKARQEHPNHPFWVLFVEIMENVHRC
jgi:speckle-type POZ protein